MIELPCVEALRAIEGGGSESWWSCVKRRVKEGEWWPIAAAGCALPPSQPA